MKYTSTFLLKNRPRILRKSPGIRNLVAENNYPAPESLVYPVFIQEGSQLSNEISSMPGQFCYSTDVLMEKVAVWKKSGIKNYALFPKIKDSLKNSQASESLNPKGFLPMSIKKIKDRFPDINIFSDVALDPFSDQGHDGIVENGVVVNDITVEILTEMALIHAQAGADFICPSDMMDGRVHSIRSALESHNFKDVGILSYSAKYASSFYGPFRDALDSAPRHGNKKSYQMDYRNSKEALKEVRLDLLEGADIVMVKPALSYLDIISKVKSKILHPVAAYNVSGEYSMVKAAAKNGWVEESSIVKEILTSIHRAGADIIFTYHAIDYAKNWYDKIRE